MKTSPYYSIIELAQVELKLAGVRFNYIIM